MSVKELLTLSKSSRIFAILLPMVGILAEQAIAEEFNTGYVLEKMPQKEGVLHIDGTIRGIAYAHYYNNDKDTRGFECINNYSAGGNDDAWQNMINFIGKHKDKPLGGVLFIYLRKKCDL